MSICSNWQQLASILKLTIKKVFYLDIGHQTENWQKIKISFKVPIQGGLGVSGSCQDQSHSLVDCHMIALLSYN